MYGVAYGYDDMIKRIKSKPKFAGSPLELIQVENVNAIQLDLSGQEDGSTSFQITAMPSKLSGMLSLHQEMGIPLQLSIGFACKFMGINLGDLTEAQGRNRNYLRDTLKGLYKPDQAFRDAVTQSLGVDPWLYAPQGEPGDPVVIKREWIPAD